MSADEIKKFLGNEKLIIGKDRVIKGLNTNNIAKVFLAKNLDEDALETIKHYAGINGVEVEELTMSNDELGTYCKKPFSVAVIGFLR